MYGKYYLVALQYWVATFIDVSSADICSWYIILARAVFVLLAASMQQMYGAIKY
jgi:hypothetical protein